MNYYSNNSSSSNYSVPTLSLRSSRTRKNIPTKDFHNYQQQEGNIQQQSRMGAIQMSNILSADVYKGRDQEEGKLQGAYQQSHYQPQPQHHHLQVPPRIPQQRPSSTGQQRDITSSSSVGSLISRNAYLMGSPQQPQSPMIQQQQQQQQQQLTQPFITGNSSNDQAITRARQVLKKTSSSSRLLLRNPESKTQIQSTVKDTNRNIQFKKLDINKSLFERKICKLMQELNFYDDQFQSFYPDQVGNQQIQQLQSIKATNKQAHQTIIRDLSALIS